MKIRDMFVDDINRQINGVIKVDQSTEEIIEQEVREYVITKDLKKHFMHFFSAYSESFNHPTSDIGVWISGFFGSGKSHFLKMLSYLLENREINGVKTVEVFRDKFKDDPATFMSIDQSTKGHTDTILFNIGAESTKRDSEAVVRVFSKMFNNYLGYYGEDLKVARLEKHLDEIGKYKEFQENFDNRFGESWIESRNAFSFYEDDIVETLMDVVGWSEEAARNWFDSTSEVDISVSALVSEVKKYIDKKPKDFRLIFMIDEVGQYVGTDRNLLLSLQTIVEKFGSECLGKVWVMATGQEAIGEIVKVVNDEFSRIQARFPIRLSLTSSSADEVIRKRILSKNQEAKNILTEVYNSSDSILRNLFTFTDSVKDIRGFSDAKQFVEHFPFIPYQFIVMQKVFGEIRKHGNAGKHLSSGERSMLSGFQEATQAIQEKDEYSIVPFYLFYNTVHTFLDGSIRRVVERCEKASSNQEGLELFDVKVLKLLYMIRYVDDIASNIDNIAILMADDIRVDKIKLRKEVSESLSRLESQNYIGRSGDKYRFLTDEEQDIQREIANTNVEVSTVQKVIGETIFDDIYVSKKFRYGINDYSFNRMVDGISIGNMNDNMTLQFLTYAFNDYQKDELTLLTNSTDRAIFVLDESSYFELFQKSQQIKKYVMQKNINNLPDSMKNIIRDKQAEASKLEVEARELLIKSIENAEVYVDKEHPGIKIKTPKDKINEALKYLAKNVYSKLDLINYNADSDEDIFDVLSGKADDGKLAELVNNRNAAAEVNGYLELQSAKNLPVNMEEIMTRYQSEPYGWREIDIAYVVARLIYEQKVNIKHSGQTISSDDPRLVNMLRQKSQRSKTVVSKRHAIPAHKIRQAKDFLRDYFEAMSLPEDEDGIMRFIIDSFKDTKSHYAEIYSKYATGNYPDKKLVKQSMDIVDEVLQNSGDNNSLIDNLLDLQDELEDNKEDMEIVENFFTNQVQIFDKAIKLDQDLRDDLNYIREYDEINEPLKKIRIITKVEPFEKYDYSLIPQLNDLMISVTNGHNALLDQARKDIEKEIRQCMATVTQAGDRKNPEMLKVIKSSDDYFTGVLDSVNKAKKKIQIENFYSDIATKRDSFRRRLDDMSKASETKDPELRETTNSAKFGEQAKITKVKSEAKVGKVKKQILLPSGTLKSRDQIDEYLNLAFNEIKNRLEKEFNNNDIVSIE